MANAPSKVLIVDKVAVIGMDICRAAAAQGCRVEVFAERSSPAFRSRFCHRRIISPPFEDAERFCDALEEIVSGESYDAIHICHEEILSRVQPWLNRGHWRGLLTPPAEHLKVALSKNTMTQMAARIGVATPRTLVPESAEEAAVAAREFGLPLVIKGDTGESSENVRIVWRREQVAEKYREVAAGETRPGSRPALQEFIRGCAYSVGGLFFKGEPIRVVAHRKLLRYPHPFGGLTVKGVTEREPDLLAGAFKTLAALQYNGLAHAEFIRDESDGRFKFLEVNARPWGTIAVARAANVDLFTPYRELAAGIPVAADLRFREGMRFHHVAREIRLIRQRPARLFGFLRDSLDPRVHSDFLWSDPGPHLPSWSRMRKFAHGARRAPATDVRARAEEARSDPGIISTSSTLQAGLAESSRSDRVAGGRRMKNEVG